MKNTKETILKLIARLCIILSLLSYSKDNACALTRNKASADTTVNVPKIREVLTSQQLFVVKLSRVKGKHAKTGLVNFKAENRDAFMIVCYDNDKSYTELNWTMCPNGSCPVPGQYKFGTPEYRLLDALIAQTKLVNSQSMKRLNALRSGEKKRKS